VLGLARAVALLPPGKRQKQGLTVAETETYTLAAAARKLGLSKDTIRRAIKTNRLYAVRNNDLSLSITEADLQAYVATRTAPASPQSDVVATPIPPMPAPASDAPAPLVGVPRDVLTLLVKNVENLEREKVELAGRNNEMWQLLRGAYRKLQRQVVEIAELQTDLTRETAEKAALQTSENRFRRALSALLAVDEDIEGE